MGAILYSIFVKFYLTGIRFAAWFNPKAKAFLRGRKNQWEKIKSVSQQSGNIIWVHCASLGEFEQGRPVIESLRINFPDKRILLTFFSPSGFELRKNYSGADYIFYLPMDSSKNAKRWIDLIKPELAIFVKYEFWHYYIQELNDADIPVLSISSIFRPNQIYFSWYGGFQRTILQRINYFFVQDIGSEDLLHNIGINQVEVTGDTRFDRVQEIKKQSRAIPEAEIFAHGHTTLVIGSAWEEDLRTLLPFIHAHPLKYILAPHEPEEKFLQLIEEKLEKPSIRFSNWNDSVGSKSDILIIDNVGMLSSLYRYGDFAWVGGAYGKGLHNILEAAVYGNPVFFGDKSYHKFKEANDLINLGGAFIIENYQTFEEKFSDLTKKEQYQKAVDANLDYIESQAGATKKIINYCQHLLK